MITTETITIGGAQYTCTRSDAWVYIQGEAGALYSQAMDPADSPRQYTESQQPLPDLTAMLEALRILSGDREAAPLPAAQAMRKLMEQDAESLDDQTVSTAPEVLPRLRGDGSLVKTGTRICWNGTVKRAAVDLWDSAENTPDAAPTLWEDIQYRQGYRIIPEVITPGQAFALGELGWWGDSLYKSLLNSNVWTPEGYPAGWERQEE